MWRRLTLLLIVVAAGLGLAAGAWFGVRALGGDDEEGARAAAAAYLEAWEQSDWEAMRGLVADPPAGFEEAHADTFERLGVEQTALDLSTVVVDGDRAEATFTASLGLAGLGDWSYRGSVPLVRRDDSWLVEWSPAVIHPSMGPGDHLERQRKWPERAPILARDGTPLVEQREVVVVGVEPRRIKNRKKMLRALERLAGADPEQVAADLDRPGVQPDWFVPVTELRVEQYEAVKPKLYPVPGVVFQSSTSRLPPADGFAHHVLGQVGEITAELLDELGEPYAVGDTVGIFGLERAFESQLAGRPSGQVDLVDAAGEVVQTLHRFESEAPQPLRTTLDLGVQTAAEAALEDVSEPAALVALDARTGALQAVASRPLEEFNRALAGRYPPGSTFKVVTTAALLGEGVALSDTVPCPPETTVEGRSFTNAEGTPSGPIPFRSAFAVSCNTAFVELTADLQPEVLADSAAVFGFETSYELPLDVAGGSFPLPADRAGLAAAAIGQGQVEASPVHMATVAAAVSGGKWQAPWLIRGERPAESTKLPASVTRRLRELMRLVVTEGTGQAANVAGAGVAGKTGSAEFGDADPPETHAWFIGFTGRLAFAVLVEGGGAGGEVAAPIAARFVEALPER